MGNIFLVIFYFDANIFLVCFVLISNTISFLLLSLKIDTLKKFSYSIRRR